MRIKLRFWLFSACFSLLVAASAYGQEMTSRGRNVAEMKLTTIPGLPTCAHGSVENGDPTKGPSIIFAKIPTGCSIPWHWHTPNEHVMIVSGVARLDMKDAKSLTLRAGGFAMLPTRHVHQFRCQQACSLYIYSDVAFDIHYVNAAGTEISPADALRAVKETAATEMK
jgi:mannose-6-phosphate isomerase-like protein (cupin superfamily)